MRLFPLFIALLLLLPVVPVMAEESVLDSVKKQAEPLLYALGMVGTPYKFGGNSPEKGMDCSGFVRHVYKQSAGVSLPHNAKAMSQTAEKIQKDELKPGDLVFFNTLKKPFSHVGIYAGDGKFVHSSSSQTKRVMVSDMKDRYWSKRFNGAARIPNAQ